MARPPPGRPRSMPSGRGAARPCRRAWPQQRGRYRPPMRGRRRLHSARHCGHISGPEDPEGCLGKDPYRARRPTCGKRASVDVVYPDTTPSFGLQEPEHDELRVQGLAVQIEDRLATVGAPWELSRPFGKPRRGLRQVLLASRGEQNALRGSGGKQLRCSHGHSSPLGLLNRTTSSRPAMYRRTREVQSSNKSTGISLPLSTLPGVVRDSKMRSWVARCSAWPARSEGVAARTGLPETV